MQDLNILAARWVFKQARAAFPEDVAKASVDFRTYAGFNGGCETCGDYDAYIEMTASVYDEEGAVLSIVSYEPYGSVSLTEILNGMKELDNG